MAVTPLFLASTEVLKDELRLRGVKESGELVIESALKWVRTDFYRRLGTSRVTTILAYPSSDNPTTTTGILRLAAEQAEQKMVFAQLLRRMTTLHKDGSADARALWNQESVWRNKSTSELNDELRRLESEIAEAFDLLKGVDTLGSASTIRADAIGPDYPSGPPGSSIRVTTI